MVGLGIGSSMSPAGLSTSTSVGHLPLLLCSLPNLSPSLVFPFCDGFLLWGSLAEGI